MIIKFWGVRGSISTPGKDTYLYGGNTTCVELRTKSGDLIIIDMGTGIRPLGYSLQKEFGENPIEADILMTHTHWDHILGLPFFTPLFHEKNKFQIYGMKRIDKTIDNILKGEYFPISLKEFSAKIKFSKLKEQNTFFLGKNKNIRVDTELIPHPGGCLGYRIQGEDGETYVHICDCEHFKKEIDPRPVKLADGADLLLHDSQYTPEEMKNGLKDGWGHSSWNTALKVGKKAKVKRLVLSHHDPTHTDEFMGGLEKTIQNNTDIETIISKEGMSIEI